MKSLKTYGKLSIALCGVFLLGGYTAAVTYEIKKIEADNWAVASLIVLVFLIDFLKEIKRTSNL